MPRQAGRWPPIDRASPNDLTTLATDRGPVPMNIGAALILDPADDIDFAAVRAVLARRVPAIRRLRQRLMRAPVGCGRPYWVDDPGFDLGRHLAEVRLVAPGETDQLLHQLSLLVCRRLDRNEPLWAARWVTGLEHGGGALILVMHHAMADGLGGLAVLAALSDEFPLAAAPATQPAPRRLALAVDAGRTRAAACRHAVGSLRNGLTGLRELRTGGRPKRAERTSLNQPTGPRRRLTTVTVPLAPVVEAGHRRGATVNDVVLTAVSGALRVVLARRGEHPGEVVISVPISARREAALGELGNRVGVVPVPVPMIPDAEARLSRIAGITRVGRSGPRGSSAAPLGLAFRTLGALGLFQPFIDHQRLVHSFETNVRGPQDPISFAGHRIEAIIPVAVSPGNVGVSFDVLSYAGRLMVTVVADPDIVPDQELLTHELGAEFAKLNGPLTGVTASR
jgi:diacylglycerol O-acyltransferase / wax synthase